ncbi:MAG TPA: hypothetical protein VGV57_06470 [Thermoleophilaceae bacterium]|nr:hypothetical protein [Thermoleophilaceae bacterium]
MAIVVVVLCGACGEDRAQAPPGEPVPLPAVPGEDALRDRFSLQMGEACSRSYAELAPLQVQLQRLQRAVRRRPPARKPPARDRARRVVEKMESRSRAFLRRLEAIPLPSPARRRQDASRLLESTEELVRLQLESLDVLSRRFGERDRVSPSERARLPSLRTQLRARLREQEALVRRLDIPECTRS